MHLLLRMNDMLDYICMGHVELPRARNKRKLQSEKLMLSGIGSHDRQPQFTSPSSYPSSQS